MSNHDSSSKKAFDYPLESSSVSSLPPSHKLNTEINVANKNHTNIIDLCEGKINIVKQSITKKKFISRPAPVKI